MPILPSRITPEVIRPETLPSRPRSRARSPAPCPPLGDGERRPRSGVEVSRRWVQNESDRTPKRQRSGASRTALGDLRNNPSEVVSNRSRWRARGGRRVKSAESVVCPAGAERAGKGYPIDGEVTVLGAESEHPSGPVRGQSDEHGGATFRRPDLARRVGETAPAEPAALVRRKSRAEQLG